MKSTNPPPSSGQVLVTVVIFPDNKVVSGQKTPTESKRIVSSKVSRSSSTITVISVVKHSSLSSHTLIQAISTPTSKPV